MKANVILTVRDKMIIRKVNSIRIKWAAHALKIKKKLYSKKIYWTELRYDKLKVYTYEKRV